MPLVVTVKLEAEEKNLGSYDALEIAENRVLIPESTEPLATHLHHRWMVHEEPHTYTELKVTGPLWVKGPDFARLGPYLTLSLVNGVMYVDQRIFGFFDSEHDDWFVTDLGKHWKRLAVDFQNEP